MNARFISLVYIDLHISQTASVTNKNGGANKKRRKSTPTLGLREPIKKKGKQANNTLASSCSVSHWAKDEWTHSRGNTQVKYTKQSMKYRRRWKEAEEHLQKCIYLFFMKVWWNVAGFFFFRGFRPTRLICRICSRTIHKSDNNSCRSSGNHSVALLKLSLLGNKCSD